ncbi:phage Gp37/Gp68 family protein [Acidovorax sp. ACV02]|uniref:phage Gp37/Gp68 family protein n=1 Tax=Acidovorax sp. ACV02 TaxID=2769310 RepID=UPI001783DC1E|nr:phage Gp37/Gp68 family protein [Acidovorax sp. ACV02]MBD9406229.1 phage Gp37/Gp68 family protein [Acidovorax sp. ACV02]
MAENTKIEWTDHTFNPWIGCTKVGPGCDHCYAENLMDTRMGVAVWGPGNSRVRTKEANWKMPLRWDAQADAFMSQHGRRQRVFCASLADVFDNAVDPQWRIDLFDLIRQTPNLDWLLLTKRVGNVSQMLMDAANATVGTGALNLWLTQWAFGTNPPSNVWLGATIVNQPEADRDIPKLRRVPARVRFLSMEPLLGPVNLHAWLCTHGDTAKPEQHMGAWCTPRNDSVSWVIVGGESGPGARPMHPDWARSLRDQCEAAGVPFLFKQWGDWKPISQMEEEEHGALYKPNVIAQPHESQDNLNEIHGRRCTVNSTVQHLDGSVHHFLEPNAFPAGAMTMFHIGKKAAGRLLDGRTWDGFPAP